MKQLVGESNIIVSVMLLNIYAIQTPLALHCSFPNLLLFHSDDILLCLSKAFSYFSSSQIQPQSSNSQTITLSLPSQRI